MPKTYMYDVVVERIERSERIMTIEAYSATEARHVALDMASDWTWSRGEAEYCVTKTYGPRRIEVADEVMVVDDNDTMWQGIVVGFRGKLICVRDQEDNVECCEPEHVYPEEE